jgi:hypothetical protein
MIIPYRQFIIVCILFFNLFIFCCNKNKSDKETNNTSSDDSFLNSECTKTFNDYFEKESEIQLSSEKEALLSYVNILRIFKDRFIIIFDMINSKLLAFDLNGKFIKSIGAKGYGSGEYSSIRSFEIDGDILYIHDRESNKILKYDSNFCYINEFEIKSACSFLITVDHSIFISDGPFQGCNIYKYSLSGELLKQIIFDNDQRDLILQWNGLAKDENNNIIHCGIKTFVLRKFDQNLNIIKEHQISNKNKVASNRNNITDYSINDMMIINNIILLKYLNVNIKDGRTKIYLLFYDLDFNYLDKVELSNVHQSRIISNGKFIIYPEFPKTNNYDKTGDGVISPGNIYALGNPSITFYRLKDIR